MSNAFNEEHRFGSARFALETELRAAGLLRPAGPQIGYWNNLPIHLDGDAPMITIGGAGSGKLRDLLGYVVCNSPGQRMLVLDPRGELAAISRHVHAVNGEHAWHWNPMGLCGLPQDRCNPLDILKSDSPNFHADAKFIVEGLVAMSGDGDGRYFVMRCREWLEALIKSDVEQHGRTSLPSVYRIVNAIESDRNVWADQLEAMLASRFDSVRRTAGEMLTKQQDSPREFGSILGEVYATLSFLDDPVLLSALEDGPFSLSALCEYQSAKAFLNIPAEYLSIWSPLVRLFFTVTMLYKARRPDAPRIMLLVDEAGQLGRFEALLRAFTYGRGAGVRAWAIFQDDGQIARNFGSGALQGFLGSAQMRQFFGVRDYQTARLVSDMLGMETLNFDEPLRQREAEHRRRDIINRIVLQGADPFEAGREYAHHKRNAGERSKQSRRLMTPDEILAMPEDRQILFISGKNLPPIYAWKYPYYTRREMAGLYLPNPYHPPVDNVPVATMFGTKRVPVITEAVPARFASFPQHRSGNWSYVEGFKPV